jgi:hypothetical protein
MHCSVVLWRPRKPNWLALSRPLSSVCFWRVFRITSSNSLPVVDRRLIGHKFWGNFGSLLGFGNVMIFASFQDFGKWDSWRQWLNKCVKCTSGHLGSRLRHSFGKPSIPQGFLNFKELNNFCKSHGLILSGGLVVYGFEQSLNLASTRRSWFSSHRSWCVNWFSKQSPITLVQTPSQSQSHIATDGQSVCLSWCRAPSGAHDQILVTVWQLLSCSWEGALSDERMGLSFVSQSAVLGPLSVCTIFTFYMCHMLLNTYTIYTRSLSVRAKYSGLCSISGSFPIMAV